MTQQIDVIQEIDAQIAAAETHLVGMNTEYLSLLRSDDGRGRDGKTAIEIIAGLIDQVRSVKVEKDRLQQMRAHLVQWAEAELMPSGLREREERARQLADQFRQGQIEAQNIEMQAKSARSRMEQMRTSAINSLRAAGYTDQQINAIHNSLQAAKNK